MGSITITKAINHGKPVIVPLLNPVTNQVMQLWFGRNSEYEIKTNDEMIQFMHYPNVEIKDEVIVIESIVEEIKQSEEELIRQEKRERKSRMLSERMKEQWKQRKLQESIEDCITQEVN